MVSVVYNGETYSGNDGMARLVDETTDALGRPVDEKIKPLVLAFLCSGIMTEASCEGHLDHGCPYPWVDFSSEHKAIVIRRLRKFNRTQPVDQRWGRHLFKGGKTMRIFPKEKSQSLGAMQESANRFSDWMFNRKGKDIKKHDVISDLTQSFLKSIIEYDPNAGISRWRPRLPEDRYLKTWNTKFAGKTIGAINREGYLAVKITFEGNGRSYLVHRLAWLYVHGEWPCNEIDHKNRIKTDNRIENLRVANGSQNSHNMRWATERNKSGYLGVSWDSKSDKWKAQIAVGGEKKHLGFFDDKKDAAEAYRAASLSYAGEFSKFAENAA